MDVVVWLRSLGLEEYEAAFRDNKINERVLPNLTADDLKEIGVGPVGHRRILLDAIAALRNDASVQTPPVEAAPARPSAATSAPVAEAVGERRHVTVMFCDLVGSTSISAGLDAEDWRDLVGAYLDAASASVTEMGGHIAKKLGDGLMALFGYPVAQENDAERAARAALSIQRALAEVNRKNAGSGKPALNARIGIETGPVVVDASGEIYGDAPNTAARVQALAEAGTVVLTAQVQRQIAGLFVVEERGNHELKGVPEPVTLFRLVRASGGGRRTGQRHLTPLVGREEEIAMLMRRWERARHGDGQLVLIVGEPGLGKSRLVEELRIRLRDTPHTWTEWSCSQLLQNTPLHPIAEWGRQRFGSADIPVGGQLAELESTLALIKIDPAENIPLLAPLLDIPLPKERLPALAPEEVRRRQLAAMTNWVIAGARSQPVVLALEDVHWADPTTIDFTRGIAERGAQAPLLLLVTARPEFRPPWGIRSHHTTISLAPLDRSQVQEMVAELSARHALSKQIIDGVTERTGGVPLFIEEVTRLLLERGEQGGVQAIPPTLQQSLMARLDRLGPAREVAQIASVIGRGFSHKLLKAVAGMDVAPLETALERLSDADIVLVEGVLPESNYRFKHALIQDAAYENLLKSRRQALHRRIAETLRDNFADKAAAEPEVLGHHYREAGMADAASTYFERAGDRAAARSAYIEATAHFRAALDEADRLPQEDKRTDRALTLLLKLGPAIMVTLGEWYPEVEAVYRRARDLGREVGDGPQLFRATWGLWMCSSRTDNKQSRKWTKELTSLAQRLGDESLLLEAQHCRWGDELFGGDVLQLLETTEEGMQRYDAKRHAQLADAFAGHDPGVCALGIHAMGLSLRGFPDQARRTLEKELDLAESLSHPPSIGLAHKHAGYVSIITHDRNGCERIGKRLVALAEKFDLPIYRWYGRYLGGWAKAQELTLSEGLALMEEAFSPIVNEQFYKFLGAALAEARFDAGSVTDALALVDHALNTGEGPANGLCVAEIHRLRGTFLKSLGSPPEEVEHALQTALEIAEEQGALLLKLRAATSLARLWREQGKVQQARELLAPVYGWFTEGFDTRDLKEAKALLEELS